MSADAANILSEPNKHKHVTPYLPENSVVHSDTCLPSSAWCMYHRLSQSPLTVPVLPVPNATTLSEGCTDTTVEEYSL
jgi:hypothetical protein